MSSAPANFDGLVGIYRALEWVAFGRDLERARFIHLAQLQACRDILVLGEGDGRALARLLPLAPHAHVHCLDVSPAMLNRAAARLSSPDRSRVTFETANILTAHLPGRRFDAVVTLFFLDCFTASEVASVVEKVQASLRPGATWLFADFSLPARGFARLRARVWLSVLYAFFRWQTKLSARALPPSEQLLAEAGWCRIAECEFQDGLVRSVVFNQPGSRT